MRVVEANALLFNFLEHPADPGDFPFPSVFALEGVEGLAERAQAQVVTLDQRMCGGAAQKPTGLLSNLLGLSE
eukprot:6601067-Pyramimonas_sp.AAC.1